MSGPCIKREHYQSLVGRSPFIYAGYICNNNCIFCFEKDQKFSYKSTKDLKKEIRIIRDSFDFINFMGREPTLRKDIFELVEHADRLKFKQIGITTNGRMFTYLNFTKRMMDSGINQIVLTVVGHTAKIHDLHTLSKGSFIQTLQGVKNIIALNDKDLSLVINLMITQKNYRSLLAIVDFYVNLGVKEINLGHILPFNKSIIQSKEVVARMKDVVPFLIKIEDKHSSKVKFLFVEYPPCVFPKKYRYLSFPCLEESPQKKHFDLCKICQYKDKCDGIHQYYINLYGLQEFKL